MSKDEKLEFLSSRCGFFFNKSKQKTWEGGKKPKSQNYIKTAKTQSSTSAHVRAKEILFTL